MKLKHAFVCLVFLLSIGKVQAMENSVSKNNLFNKIALCESGNTEDAKNPKSSASGRFQFIKSTWEHYGRELWSEDYSKKNVFDYNDNSELAWYVFDKYGVGDWQESKSCWLSHYKMLSLSD